MVRTVEIMLDPGNPESFSEEIQRELRIPNNELDYGRPVCTCFFERNNPKEGDRRPRLAEVLVTSDRDLRIFNRRGRFGEIVQQIERIESEHQIYLESERRLVDFCGALRNPELSVIGRAIQTSPKVMFTVVD